MKKDKKPNYYKEIIDLLLELKKEYPSYSIGRHISTALDEYGDVWGLPDKEVLYALNKYKVTLEIDDAPRETNDEYLNKIIRDGMNLSLSNLEDDDL